MKLPKVNLVQAIEFLHAYIKAGKTKPVLLWGPPGIGKSAAIKALADELEYGFIDARLSQLDPVDLRGVPSISGSTTQWNVPSWLPNEKIHGKRGFLLLDEPFTAARSVLNACYQLLHDGALGDYVLPGGWIILAASNRAEDKAGVVGTLDSAVLNRFATHFEIVPDVQAWSEWALHNGVQDELIAFIRFRPECLHEYPDGGIQKGTVAYSTPRSLVAASDILTLGLDANIEQAALEGAVGPAVAAELAGFLNIVRTLPDVAGILRDPKGADIPTETSTLYALASLLGKRADADNFAAVLDYLGRTSEEFAILAVAIATAHDPDLKATKAYIDFKINNKDVNI